MRKIKNKRLIVKEFILNHINSNIKEYFIILIIFLTGLVVGVFFINNVTSSGNEQISVYLNTFIENLKGDNQIDRIALLKDSIISNIKLGLLLWFVGSTVIGIPIVYGTIAFRGFCLGYTISAIILVLRYGERDTVRDNSVTIAKYNIYSLYFCSGSEWNETL